MSKLREKLNELMPSGRGPSGRGRDLDVPAFASDLYRDLRERHLLPLVGVLLVAIVAVPFLLGDSGEGEESGEPPVPPVASSSNAKNAGQVVVAESNEGLRDYRKRLGHRQASNPFQQQYTGSPSEASGEGSTLEEGTSSSPAPDESTGGTSGSGTSGEGGETRLHYFTYTIDVRIVPVSTNGVPSDSEPYVRRNLPRLTMLPAKKTPALTFMQPSADEEKALMLVNSNVKGLFGDAVCVSGGETCQMLALQKGIPETVVYGGNERVFRIELLKINLVETDPPKQTPQQQPSQNG
jgi:hypothetical protein